MVEVISEGVAVTSSMWWEMTASVKFHHTCTGCVRCETIATRQVGCCSELAEVTGTRTQFHSSLKI